MGFGGEGKKKKNNHNNLGNQSMDTRSDGVDGNASLCKGGPSSSGLDAFSSQSPASIVQKLHDIKKLMLEGKLVLFGGDRLPMKPSSKTNEGSNSLGGADIGACSSIGGDDVEAGASREHQATKAASKASCEDNLRAANKLTFIETMPAIPISFASMVTPELSKRVANFRMLNTRTTTGESVEILIPLSSVLEANARGVELCPVWVKLHDIPVTVFTKDGLSVIATRLGKPIMLDSYTSTMCMDSWGRMDFARALVEIKAGRPLKDTIVIAIPLGFSNVDDINFVSLRNSFAALNDQDNVFEIVENSEAENVESKSGEKFIEDSESDVEVTYNENAQFMAFKGMKEGSGFGNKSLYEQRKDSNVDDEYDPYDDD
ncbi:zinc knuckle CX2CX4HX4C containing protein [Tanacetum coccineum]|uniref:Zinc knuckle CX2CX4HX4C containing protein n=1 Tax=Tanacetum coccineum TaxID=301880 RepID=A0ABQ5FM18_9ASTR